MSLTGQINKVSGDFRRAVNQIARQGIVGLEGVPLGTRKIIGYVCAINEEGELAGTVDVQEFNYEPDEYSTPGIGHHKGVFLSAIQDNNQGYLIVPMLYSEVVIVQNPTDGHEYVLMYSHAQKIKLLTNSLKGDNDGVIEIGVTEVENFVETDDGLEKDFNELEPTQNQAKTAYTATTIIDQIISPDDTEGLKQEKTVEHKIITVGDTKITIDGQNVCIETSGRVSFKVGNSTITEEDGKVSLEVGNSTITEEDGKVSVKVGDTTITEENGKVAIDTKNCEVKGSDIKVNGSTVTITGGTLKAQGISNTDLNGPFNAIKACPFSGAPHCGSQVSGT